MNGYDPLTVIGFGASVLGVIITGGAWLGGWLFGRATNRLIVETAAQTQRLLDRMDQRADERHREVIQAIQALRP